MRPIAVRRPSACWKRLPLDVVLLDVMMPGVDGPSTFLRMQANPRTSEIPVIFLTAKVQRHEVRDLKELGAVGVLAKPFNPLTLAAEIDGVLKGRSS